MALQGIFASHQGIVGDRVGDFANAVLRIWPQGNTPLIALSSGMAKSGSDTSWTWFEEMHISGRTTVTTGAAVGVTTLVVGDGSTYIPGVILIVEETGEYLLVLAAAGNSLTVSRGFAGTTQVAITTAHHVQQIGNAHEEGSDMPIAVHNQGHPRINYTQIFRNSWAITGSAKATKFHTGDRMAESMRECAQFHAEDMERAFVWGRKHIGTLNGNQLRLTDGLVTQIENNGGIVSSAASGDVPGQLSLGDFSDFLRQIFAKNIKGQPNERMAFCGDIVLQTLNRAVLLDSTYQIFQNENKWGINVSEIQTVFGRLKLMSHPLMNENPVWQKQLYVYHPGGIAKKVFRETFYDDYNKSGTRPNGRDADQGVITTEAGIEVKGASVMGIMRNISTAVATV